MKRDMRTRAKTVGFSFGSGQATSALAPPAALDVKFRRVSTPKGKPLILPVTADEEPLQVTKISQNSTGNSTNILQLSHNYLTSISVITHYLSSCSQVAPTGSRLEKTWATSHLYAEKDEGLVVSPTRLVVANTGDRTGIGSPSSGFVLNGSLSINDSVSGPLPLPQQLASYHSDAQRRRLVLKMADENDDRTEPMFRPLSHAEGAYTSLQLPGSESGHGPTRIPLPNEWKAPKVSLISMTF